ncbi:S-layer protein domain-containing protein [Methanolobus psychrotolerans]|uniref:S-layer protein domain-containing protein n=1 Tax=Methanolobus psychrotolerans TaxID=1874706 RepID=UPI000B916580|nr:S-layer protein domain-containing protein [Methanolobus psychrotolerans]
MKKILTVLIIVSVSILVLIPASASDATYQLRSNVYDNTDPSTTTGNFYWDANSFPGFWYQISPGLSSEVLYFHNNVNSSSTFQLGDKVVEGDLYYVSKPQVKTRKIGGSDAAATYIVDGVDLEKYYLMGLFGSQYLAMPEDPATVSAGCQPDKIAKLLMEQKSDDKKQMFSGEEWELAGGWSLVAQQIDVEGNKVWVELKKNGEAIDSDVISTAEDLTRPQRTYLYKDNDDYPVFYCYVDSIFRGTTSDFVVFKYAFLMDDINTIENGDTYGVFDVTGFEVPAVMNATNYAGSGSGTVLKTGDDALVMSSNDDIILNPDETIDLCDSIYLKTEDTKGSCLKMTLQKTCTITVPDKVVGENAVKEDAIEDEAKDVVVIDMAEEETKSLSFAPKETVYSTNVESEDNYTVESSVKTPGFESLLGALGIIAALRFKKKA